MWKIEYFGVTPVDDFMLYTLCGKKQCIYTCGRQQWHNAEHLLWRSLLVLQEWFAKVESLRPLHSLLMREINSGPAGSHITHKFIHKSYRYVCLYRTSSLLAVYTYVWMQESMTHSSSICSSFADWSTGQ